MSVMFDFALFVIIKEKLKLENRDCVCLAHGCPLGA